MSEVTDHGDPRYTVIVIDRKTNKIIGESEAAVTLQHLVAEGRDVAKKAWHELIEKERRV